MTDFDNCAVRLIDLPPSVGGFVTESPDGFQNIYINARHGLNAQHESFRHELTHIDNDDLHSVEDIRTVEARANGTPQALRSIPCLIRAADLPRPQRRPVKLTPHQAAVLLRAVNDLGKFTS